tara:strand:+ start:7764 stop:8249 length:486 start_codon:yes stop_codon:yes gene_type:complete
MPSQKISENNDNDFYQNDENGEHRPKVKRRRYHPTKLGGVCINAQTGQRYSIMQGSFEELRLYKMIDATAFYDKNGFLRERKDPVNPDPNILFYDSPEEYMRHMKVKIPQDRVNRWHMNQRRMFPDGGQFDKAAYEEIRKESHTVRMNSERQRESSSEDEW